MPLREQVRFQWWPWLFLAGLLALVPLMWLRDEPARDAMAGEWARLGPARYPDGSEAPAVPVSIAGRLRQSLVAPLNTSFDVEVPAVTAPRLSFALGALTADEQQASDLPLQCEVRLLGEQERVLFQKQRPLERWSKHWFEHEVDLHDLLGQPVTLRFQARGEPAGVQVAWGNLLVAPEPGPPRGTPVVFVSIDTLAAKHMSLYGYPRETTPCLQEFARDAVIFDSAFCQQSWTLTSHMSMFTSLFPDSHRVTLGSALPADLPLLPDLLQDAGYFTAGLINNPYLQPEYGYGRGYDYYDHDHVRRDAKGQKTNRSMEDNLKLLGPLLARAGVAPLFLFYHAVDAHSDWRELPYEAPGAFADRFVAPGQKDLPVSEGDRKGSWYLAAVNSHEASLSPEQAEYFAALYDGGVAYTDHGLGELFHLLRDRRLYDASLIVVTSDHGEEFLEHGRTMHTQGYDEILHVPLLMKLPHSAYGGTRVSTMVQLVDLMPTILETLGRPVPAACEGRSLLPLLRGEPGDPPPVFAKGENYSLTARDVYVLRTPEWKLLWRPVTGSSELYHLTQDPAEQSDVGERFPDVRDRLLELLRAHRAERDQGYHLRVSPFEGPGTLHVEVRTDGTLEGVRVLDTNQLPRQALAVQQDTPATASFDVDAGAFRKNQPVGLDFQVGAASTWLEIRGTSGDGVSPALAVGPGQAALLPLRISPEEPSLQCGETPAGCNQQQEGPRLWLWKSAPGGAVVQLSAEDREVLQAMGYVETGSE